MDDYTKQAQDFLNKHNIRFSALFKGDKCPLWDDGRHIHGDRYLIGFRGDNRLMFLSFWNSYNDAHNNIAPTAYDVIAAMTKYDPEDYMEFCASYGYDWSDAKVKKIYTAVVKEWEKVSSFFTEEELNEMRDIN